MPKVTLEDWKLRIESGKQYRQDAGRDSQWGMFTDYFRHNFDEDEYIVNNIFSIGKTLVPQISLYEPQCIVSPLSIAPYGTAMILETLNNIWLRMPEVRRTIRKACYIAYLKGTAILKVGYDSLLGLEIKDSFDSSINELISQSQDIKDNKYNLSYYDNIKKNLPWLGVVQPENFVVPYHATTIYDSPWCAHQIFMNIDELKAHKELKNTSGLTEKNIISFPSVDNFMYQRMFDPGYSSKDGVVSIWEVFDRFRKEHFIFVEDYGKFLWEDREWEGNFPFVPLIFNEDPETFWGIPDVRIILPQQQELDKTKQVESDHVARSVTKLLVSSDLIESEDWDSFLSDKPLTVVRTKPGTNHAGNLTQIQPHISQDFFAHSETVQEDMREASGFSRNQQGANLGGRRTATESRIIQVNADIRNEDRRDILSDALGMCLDKMNDLICTFWTDESVLPIIGPDLSPMWVTFKGEQLKGQFDKSVQISPTSMPEKLQHRQDLMQIIPLLQSSPIYQQNPGLQLEIFKMLLETFPGISLQRILMQLGGNNANIPIPLSQLQQTMGGIQQNQRQGLGAMSLLSNGRQSGTPAKSSSSSGFPALLSS